MRLIPRRVEFFDLLEELASTVQRGATLLYQCFEARGTLDDIRLASQKIHDVEHEADEIAHKIFAELNRTFITPLDREDIYALTVRLDDVLDFTDAVAKRLVTFRVSAPLSFAVELSRLVMKGAEEVAAGVRLMRDLRQTEKILAQCARINQIENDADFVLREALNDLFNGGERDPIDIIKWKDLYEHLEVATDKCEDVANVIETVLVKHA